MGLIRKTTDLYLGSIGSTKVVNFSTSESLYQISSGMRAVEIINQGPSLAFYGQSGLTTNSGGVFINTGGGAKFWDSVIDNFGFALRGTSNGTVIFHEYAGNG